MFMYVFVSFRNVSDIIDDSATIPEENLEEKDVILALQECKQVLKYNKCWHIFIIIGSKILPF